MIAVIVQSPVFLQKNCFFTYYGQIVNSALKLQNVLNYTHGDATI